jgi:drug/metabolite transporter (DMT)-like permease
LGDLWPRSIVAVGAMREGRALRLIERLELFLYRRAAAVVALTSAFKDDLVARGIAPVLVLVLSVIVALSWPSAGEVVGVLAVAAGVLLVRGFRGSLGGLAAGALIAAVIAGYTVADRYGIHHANAAPYLMLVLLPPAVAYPLFVGRRRYAKAFGPATVVIGVASACAYLLVLLALRLASAPAVAAVRETSVVIATVLAAVVLKERVGPVRLAGAVLVAAGVALLALS